MKIRVSLFVPILIVVLFSPSFAVEQNLSITLENQTKKIRKPMNLADLTQLALKQNPGLQAVRNQIDVSHQGILAAKGQRFGRVDLDISDYTYGPDNLPLVMKTLVVDQKQIIRDGAGKHNNNLFSLGGRISIPIYTGGRITNQISVQKLGRELARNRLVQTKDELIFNVASAYYNILKFQDFIRAARKSKEQLLESQRVVQRRFALGKTAKVDTLKVNTRLAAVEQLLIRFSNIQEVLYGLLGVLLGDEAGQLGSAVSGDLRMPARKQMQKSYSLQKAQRQALQRRPELLALKKELEIQEKRIRIRYAENLPNISFRGQVQGITGDNSDPFAQTFAGVFFSMPLFTGGTIKAKVSQERLRHTKLRNEWIQLKLNVTQEVYKAHLNMREAKQRIYAAQAAEDEAIEVLRIEALKVREGKSIIENLLDAQTAQLEAEQNFSAAVADYQIQLMALKKAIGTIEVEG